MNSSKFVKKVGGNVSKIVNVQAGHDYKLLIDFEDGSSITYNMQEVVKTIPYLRLKDSSSFQAVKFDKEYVYWDAGGEKPEYFPLRLSVDAILFSIRD